MGILDISIVSAAVFMVVFAIRSVVKEINGSGGCGNCSGCAQSCDKKGN